MKLRIALLTLLLFVTIPVATLHAQGTDAADQTPAERCVVAQNYLKNIQKPRDLRARVDRLQAYRYIYQRLEVFAIRLEKNDQPGAREFQDRLNRLNQAIESFKDHYESYDAAREAVQQVTDCRRNVSEFQVRLAAAREARQKVHADVLTIQGIFNPEILTQLTVITQKLETAGEAAT